MVPMEAHPLDARPVQAWPCQSVCVWAATGETWRLRREESATQGDAPDLRVFACAACGSEWVRTEAWTPVDALGAVPPDVLAERRTGTP
jgi:hypothetical protein